MRLVSGLESYPGSNPKWETGQGKPTGAAATLLRVIDANPRVVEKALEKSA